MKKNECEKMFARVRDLLNKNSDIHDIMHEFIKTYEPCRKNIFDDDDLVDGDLERFDQDFLSAIKDNKKLTSQQVNYFHQNKYDILCNIKSVMSAYEPKYKGNFTYIKENWQNWAIKAALLERTVYYTISLFKKFK